MKLFCKLGMHNWTTIHKEITDPLTLVKMNVEFIRECSCGAIQHKFENLAGHEKVFLAPTYTEMSNKMHDVLTFPDIAIKLKRDSGYWKTVFDPYKK